MNLIINDNGVEKKYILNAELVEIKLHGTTGQKELKELDLTETEWKIIKMVSEGKMAKEIAPIVFMSERTVEAWKDKIRAKLGYPTQIQMIVDLVRGGYI